MSKFYGTITGTGKAPATRRGTATTGLVTTARSYFIGAQCSLENDFDGIHEKLVISLDKGSNNSNSWHMMTILINPTTGKVMVKDLPKTKEIEKFFNK